ncbi:hypothetical protein CYY_002211 [Polysphondylium violaceum]|uniref:Uncharacterized protein n=1 Tax=Polysphondylium violaceum TaxID=133409 RepID=A0A8J4UVD5_9MYCE|nr:hypothetical protein CYY_002211 [Polysphondylium violaceum]
MSGTPKKNPNGSIAFPYEFTVLKKKQTSEINSELETLMFSYNGKEYNADSNCGLVLQEMGWDTFTNDDKKRIATYFVDHCLHSNGILFSPGGFEGESSPFSKSMFSIFKPTFTYPEITIDSKGDLTMEYWNKDYTNNTVKFNRIVIDSNGDIKSRKIIKSYRTLALFLVTSVAFVGFVLMKKKLIKL